MSTTALSADISQAILNHVEFKAYPESEQTASAELTSSNLTDILSAIGREREKVRVRQCGSC